MGFFIVGVIGLTSAVGNWKALFLLDDDLDLLLLDLLLLDLLLLDLLDLELDLLPF